MLQSTDENLDSITAYLKDEDLSQNKSVMFMTMLADQMMEHGIGAEWAGKIACTPRVSIGEDADTEKMNDLAHHLVKSQISAVKMVMGHDTDIETLSEGLDRSFIHLNLTL